jgi:archaellum component FlaC
LASLGKNGGDAGHLKDLEADLARLKADLSKFRDEVGNSFKLVNDMLSKKADKSELIDLENRLIDKLNEMLKSLFNQFADKNDTRKRLTNLEKNVKILSH